MIRRHGAWAVLVAALRALLVGARQRRSGVSGELPDYLRRDVGITPTEQPRRYWDYL